MNRNFENRKPTKVYAKSKENQMIIKALNMFGRVPEQYELLEEIERLNKRILALEETIRKANNNILKDIAMIKTHEMIKQEIVQRLIETSKILESGSDKE